MSESKKSVQDILGVQKLNVLEQTTIRGGSVEGHHHHDTASSHHHDDGRATF